MAARKDGRLGVALVGLGRAGHFHLESIKRNQGSARLVWAVDVDTERARRIASEHRGCAWAATLDQAIADPEVDTVIVASATDTHFPFIMQALRGKKAVFAEKPISHEIHEVEEAVQFASQENLPLVCGFQRRADANFRELKRQLDGGVIGQLKVVKSCSRDNPIPPMEYLRTSGGIFHDMLVHDFDMLDFLSGGQTPESVTSVGHCYNAEIREMGDIDTCAVMFKYPSGLLAMVDTSRDAAYGYDQRVEAFGERGMVSAKNELTSTVELATASGHLTPCAQWSFPQRYAKAYAIELAEFIQMLRAGSESDAHKKEQEMMQRHPRLIRTTVAAELSWHLNRTVRLDEVDGLVATDAVSAEKETIISTAPPQESDLRGAAPSSEEDRVLRTYRDIHRLQTVEGVKAMRAAFRKLDKAVTSIEEMICFLDTVVDESDPDEGLPRSFFAYQLAESMMSAYLLADREKLAFQPKGVPIESLFSAAELRELPAVAQSMYAGKTLATLYPHVEDWSWLPLTALMHDLGKVCMHETFGALPQWSIVGDTFVVGCDFDPANVFAGRDFYSQNPDSKVQGLQGKLGMYSSQCGFDNVLLSFGHNEYLATVLEGHAQDVAESTERPPRTLPREAVYLIRYQSFQPWHSPPQGQARGYAHLASEEDWRMLPLLKALHKSSAGAKTTALPPPIGEQHAFYGKLLSDYFLTQLRW